MRLLHFFKSPKGYIVAIIRKCVRVIPNSLYLKLLFWLQNGYKLDLHHPKTFNEKLQWLKLNDKNDAYTKLVDKYDVKKIVGSIIGEQLIIPTVGIYHNFDEVDINLLPEKFVLKTTHSSGGVFICKDKSTFDWDRARHSINNQLKHNLYYWGLEWPYKNCEPRIIIEDCLEHPSGDLRDYKLMCFNGKVRCSFICAERYSVRGLQLCFFDEDWKKLPFTRSHPMFEGEVAKPKYYKEMVCAAEKLCSEFNIPFARVDFYETEERFYFGELTFFPGCGFEPFQPRNWDYILGEWLDLPQKINCNL